MRARPTSMLGLMLLLAAPAAAQDGVPAAIAARVPPAARYEASPLAPEDDGYASLRRASGLLHGFALEAKGLPSDDASLPREELETLSRNGLSLWLFEQARARPAFRWPPFQVGDESFHRYRQVFLLALLHARQERERGDLAAAAAELRGILTLAQRMASGDPQVIHLLATLAIERRVFEEILALARSHDVSAELVAGLAQAVVAAPTPCAIYAHALRVELNTFWIPDLVDAERHGKWKGAPLGDAVERAGEALASYVATCGAMSALVCRAAVENVDFDFEPFAYDAAVWQWGAQRAATEAILALRIYQLRFGRLPASLDDLAAAGIVGRVPHDPFNAVPVGYDAVSGEVSLETPAGLFACGAPREATRLAWRLASTH